MQQEKIEKKFLVNDGWGLEERFTTLFINSNDEVREGLNNLVVIPKGYGWEHAIEIIDLKNPLLVSELVDAYLKKIDTVKQNKLTATETEYKNATAAIIAKYEKKRTLADDALNGKRNYLKINISKE